MVEARELSIRLYTPSDRDACLAFFERLGFRTVEIEKDGFGPGLDRHEMALALGALD